MHFCQVFIRPLRNANPSIIRDDVNEFIEEVFGNILDLRELNRHLLETLHIRQREQGKIISRIGDLFFDAVTEFQLAYPVYIGQIPGAEKRLREEMESNGAFGAFLDVCTRFPRIFDQLPRVDLPCSSLKQCSRHKDNPNKRDLEHWLNRPLEHLQKYTALFEAIRTEAAEGNPDVGLLRGAAEVTKDIHRIALLRAFQASMGKGTIGKFEWHNLVSEDVRDGIGKQEAKRQA